MTNKLIKTDRNYLIISVICIFLLGSVFHFIFDICGRLVILAPFFPTNESIFEHLKLSLYPILIVNTLFSSKAGLSIKKQLVSSMISIVMSIFLVVVLYYALKYGFNVHSLPVDLLIYLISLIIGQILFIHSENYLNFRFRYYFIALILLIILIVLFAYFSFNPPALPLFQDPQTLGYGLY